MRCVFQMGLCIIILQNCRTYCQRSRNANSLRGMPSILKRIMTRAGDDNVEISFNSVSNGNTCRTPSGETGRCVRIHECPELVSFIRSNGVTTDDQISFLRSRICRFVEKSVNLCCLNTETRSGTTKSPTLGTGNVIPSRSVCGFTTIGRITNGKDIKHGSHPWLAGVGYFRRNKSFRILCGGTLITKKHVLTAAHCFEDRAPGSLPITHVRLGEHSQSQENEREPPVTLLISDRRSPGYDNFTHLNDIELLILEKDVTFTEYIRPACLPIDLDLDDQLLSLQFLIVGWGDTFFRSFQGSDTPKAANITAVTKAVCRESFKNHPEVPLDDTQFCAGIGDRDACQGDSGGPLLYQDFLEHKRTFLLGIVSFGVGCGNSDFPGVYTFLPEFLPWIRQNLAS